MTNPKGTAAETKVVNWLHANGFPGADRIPKAGARDRGDVAIAPGVIAEVKAWKLTTGYPTRAQLNDWMRQTQTEATNANADVGVLIVKRPGTTDVARWYGHITTATFLNLLGVPVGDLPIGDSTVMLPVDELAILLRVGEYGTPIDKDAGCEGCRYAGGTDPRKEDD